MSIWTTGPSTAVSSKTTVSRPSHVAKKGKQEELVEEVPQKSSKKNNLFVPAQAASGNKRKAVVTEGEISHIHVYCLS